MMVGSLSVGYNHQKLLHKHKMSMEKDVRPYPDTGKKFQYPATIYAGQPIGIFEVVFDTKSHFTYKINDFDSIHEQQA